MKLVVFKIALITLATSMVPTLAYANLPEEIDKEVKGYVSELTKSSDLDVRQGVTMARGYLNDQESQKAALEAAKSDPKIQLRIAAVFAAAEQGDDAATFAAAEQGDDAATTFLIEQLKGPQANEALYDQVVSLLPDEFEKQLLAKILSDQTFKNQGAALGYLSRQHGPLYDLFVAQMLDPATSKQATSYAQRNRDPRMLDLSEKMLQSKDPGVQKNGLTLLNAIAAIPSMWLKSKPYYVRAMGSSNADVAKGAIEALVQRRQPEALEPTLKQVATASGDPSTQAALLQLLADNGYVTSKALVAPYLTSKDEAVRQAAYILAATDAEVQAEIMKMVRSTEFGDRLIALKAAGYTDSDAAAAYLAKSLFEARRDVRLLSAQGLKKLARASTVAQVKQSMQREKDPEIKEILIQTLGAIGTDDAVTPLIFSSHDRNPAVRKAVVEGLGASKNPKALPELTRMIRDRNREIQWAAFLALLDIDARQAHPFFQEIFRNPSDTFIIDIDQRHPDVRTFVYRYLLTENSGSARHAALAQVLMTGEFDKEINKLALDDTLAPKVRRRILTYLADRASRSDLMILDNVARTSQKPEIAQFAAWLMLRAPATQEASFRGFLAGKDDKKRAVGVLGIALNHKSEVKAKKKVKRRGKGKKRGK